VWMDLILSITGGDVDDDVSALRHEYRCVCERKDNRTRLDWPNALLRYRSVSLRQNCGRNKWKTAGTQLEQVSTDVKA
ncbi:MAG: hypothetical protein ACREBC_31235, partial [Pyrinomonadaceae bacterium]